MKHQFLGNLTIILMTVLTVTACDNNQVSKQPAVQSINIGTVLGLSGEGAAYGQKMQRGFELAIEKANSSNKDKQPQTGNFKLSIEDSQFDPAKAVSAYQKLKSVQNIKTIVGITGSKNAVPVCQSAKADDVVIIDALSSAPKISTVCGSNYFRVIASDALAGQYNVDWAIENKMKTPVVVYMEDDWGTSYRDSTIAHLTKKGFKNVPVYGITEGSRDFRSQIEKIKSKNPDTVFLLIYAKTGASFMQQMRQAGVKAVGYGSDNLSSPEFVAAGNQVVEGVRVALPASGQGGEFDKFAADYKSKYGEVPDAVAGKSYDAMNLAIYAIQKVGDNPAKITSYLKSTEFNFQGVTGSIKFNDKGDLISQNYSRQAYKNGSLVGLK
jgi:branched-chain amino acid transport system substrate-binding protein